MEIQRSKELSALKEKLQLFPVVGIIGPRQCGKTTLARQLSKEYAEPRIHFFDLEDPTDVAKLDQPMLALEGLEGLVIIDEVQRRPEIFPSLRVLADRHSQARYLVLGSASRDLLAQSSETLAGRIAYLELGGFNLGAIASDSTAKLWVRGGFPRSYLAVDDDQSFEWRQEFIATFLERDIPNLGIRIPAKALRRFWIMLAHYHGQVFDASEIGRSLAVADTTARRYLDILSGTFIVRQLQPWFYNTKKRVVKRPKIYFRDSGLFHALLSLKSRGEIASHPKLGASWEGFALEQAIEHLGLCEEETFYWALHTGGEVDLVFQAKGRLYGVEAKYSDAPTFGKSMRFAMKELELAHLWVIHPGKENYRLEERATAVAIRNLSSLKI